MGGNDLALGAISKKRSSQNEELISPEITVKTKKQKASLRNEGLILPPNLGEDKKKTKKQLNKKTVFTELKADFTRIWQAQDILLHSSEIIWVQSKFFWGKVTNSNTAHAYVA